ncbi:MAG TPA: alkaline phosphatase D family protein, partial [Burkholderiaceae bacterium]|nr:alkaline phosphatase D family protein [Burkholderiaceae bacterium]
MHHDLPSLSRRCWLAHAGAAALAPAFVRHARAADVPRFALGVASGQPRERSIVLWTRLTGNDLPARATVRWTLARDERFADIAARGSEDTGADDAHSVHAEVTGLEPGRHYWYRFEALGQRSATGRTRTAPAPDAAAGLRFALASCQRFDHGHYAAWRHVAASELDLVVFVGDYIYEYPSPPVAVRYHEGPLVRTLEQYRARYAQYKSDPSLQAAHAAMPWLLVWDDHEVDNDYADDHSEDPAVTPESFLARRAAAYQAWWEHMPVRLPPPDGTKDYVTYRQLSIGGLAEMTLIDTRQYRSDQTCGDVSLSLDPACPETFDDSRTMLGATQEQWVAKALGS